MPTSEGAVFFDAGLASSGQPLLDALEAHGLSAADVTDVFLTHGHGDHVGGLTALPDARVRGFAVEQAVLDEEGDGVTIDTPVTAGEMVDVGGFQVEVFHVPGHTPGSAAYLVDGVLILGDSAVITPNGRLGQPPAQYTDDVEQLDRSLFAVRDRLRFRPGDVAWIACAHSGPSEGPDALLAYGGVSPRTWW